MLKHKNVNKNDIRKIRSQYKANLFIIFMPIVFLYLGMFHSYLTKDSIETNYDAQ